MTNQEFFITSWERISKVTAKGFRSLPNDLDKLTSQRHHPKFRSPWELVNHIGPHAKEIYQALSEGKMELINEGKFDIKAPHIYKSTEDAAKAVEEFSAKLPELVKNCDEKTWTSKMIPVYWGPAKIMDVPLMQACWMMHHDTVYHLGQLTSYYRMMGTNQPNLMGPTSEEEDAMMAAAQN